MCDLEGFSQFIGVFLRFGLITFYLFLLILVVLEKKILMNHEPQRLVRNIFFQFSRRIFFRFALHTFRLTSFWNNAMRFFGRVLVIFYHSD